MQIDFKAQPDDDNARADITTGGAAVASAVNGVVCGLFTLFGLFCA